MNRLRWNTVTQSAAFVGFAVSVFLMGEYLLPPSSGGCPVGGGCHIVRACQVLAPSFVWPILGSAGFLVLLVLSLSSRTWARHLLRYLATLGLLVGMGLMVAQPLVCGAFCPYCLVTDTAAFVVAIGAWFDRGEPVFTRRRLVFVVGSLVAIAGVTWRHNRISGVQNEPSHLAQLPVVIAREQQSGIVTIVEFMDFTCPHCRVQHPELVQAISPYASQVRVLRKFPWPDSPDAENMARAQYCAEAQGKPHEMVELLIHVSDGTRENCESQAAQLGLDVAAFRRCIDAPETTARLREDHSAGTEAQVLMLPTLFVGHDRFDGNVSAATLRTSIERALRTSGVDAPPPALP